MNLGRYRVLAQLGAGPGGVRYRAAAPGENRPIELRVLTPGPGWEALQAKLARLALLEHPAALRIIELALEHEPPFLVMEAIEPGELLPSGARPGSPMEGELAAKLVQPVAAAVAAAHTLGAAVGAWSRERLGVRTGDSGQPRVMLDPTGLDLWTPPASAWTEPRTPADREADVYGLGRMLEWLAGKDWAGGSLIDRALDSDPASRPTAREFAERLVALGIPAASTQVLQSVAATRPDAVETWATAGSDRTLADATAARPGLSLPERLGRFVIINKLGQGGMGTVFRARDEADGAIVALKVLRADLAGSASALRRFHKEARLLAEINNPFVTALLDVNEDAGVHYLAMEFVDGTTLDRLLAERGRFAVGQAMDVVVQVARALEDAHERGIVHRDVKPQNILVLQGEAHAQALRVKLSDFGLARHAVETESLNLTQTGTVLGTPLYMAPEQCAGQPVSPPTDVYAMGATLFHLIAGRPPFEGETAMRVMAQHVNEPAPALKSICPEAGEALSEVVAKALAKAPSHRYPTAGAFRKDLERILRGEPTGIGVHPRLPEQEAADVVAYDWAWSLQAPPRRLWPLVSNTERLNRAVGLPAVNFTMKPEREGQVRKFGQFRRAGVNVSWEEHPFEWVEGRRMGVLREYSDGPWRWMASTVELEPRADGGTLLSHKVRIAPRGLMGRTIAAVNVGHRARQSLDQVYRRIDASLTGGLPEPATADPFEPPAELPAPQRARLEAFIDRLLARGIPHDVADRLGTFLATAPAQEVARIRPIALANRLQLDPEQTIAACLQGAREGLLILLWDLICPLCRLPSQVQDTLRALKEHGHCEACQIDYELDFAHAVELVFRVHPEIRSTEIGTYCTGGPANMPHVVAQARVAPGERMELELELEEGAYRVRGPQLPFVHEFRVQAGAPTGRLEIELRRGPTIETAKLLRPGGQAAVFENGHDTELVVRVERAASRADALTAARASAMALFRELFPSEVLSPGQLATISAITLLVTTAEVPAELDDAQWFAMLHQHFQIIADRVRKEGGALIKTIGDGTISAFTDPLAALRAALALGQDLAASQTTEPLRVRLGLHRGMAHAATINDRLDYFGKTVKLAASLPALGATGELILTSAIAADPPVAAFLQQSGLRLEVLGGEPLDSEGPLVHRVRCPQSSASSSS